MVPRAGIEPARPLSRRILSPLRLPIPPPRLSELMVFTVTTRVSRSLSECEHILYQILI